MWVNQHQFVNLSKLDCIVTPFTAIVSIVGGPLALQSTDIVSSGKGWTNIRYLGWMWMGILLPIICNGHPVDMYKLYFLS
jgi:hypothetical protein